MLDRPKLNESVSDNVKFHFQLYNLGVKETKSLRDIQVDMGCQKCVSFVTREEKIIL